MSIGKNWGSPRDQTSTQETPLLDNRGFRIKGSRVVHISKNKPYLTPL